MASVDLKLPVLLTIIFNGYLLQFLNNQKYENQEIIIICGQKEGFNYKLDTIYIMTVVPLWVVSKVKFAVMTFNP